jgi:hypothetical protein
MILYATYFGKSLNVIRNYALDRFGTPLEQRFSRNETHKMLVDCGFTEIVLSEKEP